MSFSDILQSGFIDNVSSVSMFDMLITTILSFAIGLFIMFVYKKTYRGVMYSQSFCVSLMAMSLVTTILILAVTNNVILSLGMVGALSIVRFRTAIKEPLDIAFLFWSIAVGIMLGAGFIVLALYGSIVVGVLLLVFVKRKQKDAPYILVVNCKNDSPEKEIMKIIEDNTDYSDIKAKSVSKKGMELTLELRLEDSATNFVNMINNIDDVDSAILVTYNGEYAG